MNKVVITKMPSLSSYTITAQYLDDKLMLLDCDNQKERSLLNNIYVGKVKNLVPNIAAAFIEIEKGVECYYSLEDNKHPVFVTPKKDNKVKIGDEIIVQVAKENIKTKQPVLTSDLTLTGKYVVVSYGNNKMGLSNKLTVKEKLRIKELFAEKKKEPFGIIARTNVKHATDEQILEEVGYLKEKLQTIIDNGFHRTCYSVLYEGEENYITILKGLYEENQCEIITDEKDIYEKVKSYLAEHNSNTTRTLTFYEDSLLPLYKLKSLESELKHATQERVWLNSGAYLVIQPTEAFTVIDINTGKFTGKKNTQETFLKINLEAAKEIARQLRLRNISGIVVIDFIDMERMEDKKILMEDFDKILKKDPVKTILVGISKLNLVELTRKKVRKSLREQVMMPCSHCNASGYVKK